MRVASRTIYDMAKFNLSNITEQMYKANETVSTGKRILDLSDDPVALTQALNIRSSLSNIEQLGRNITLGTTWLSASESALTQIQDLLSDAGALCVQMVSGSRSAADRTAASEITQNIMAEMISLANTEVNGRYVFSGSETGATPFDQDGSYNGDNNTFSIKAGNDSTIEVGSDGEAVFGSLFNDLTDLKAALESDDVNGIKTAMTSLESDFDSISSKISDVGSKMLRMETRERILQELNLHQTNSLSNIEDADMAEAILEIKSIEFAYQAALSSSANVMKLSLMNYM